MTNLNNLSDEISQQLLKYARLADEEIKSAMDDVSKDLVKNLKSDSPKGKRTQGKYSKGWKIKRTKKKYTIYNTQYQLTHLLEHGHAKVNGGRTRAFPHIAPNEIIAIREFLDRIERAVNP